MIILIVDDNELNLYQLQILLGANGYQVVTAANGAEALAKARQAPPDLVVSDILMPVMDGFTLCREWKKDEGLRRIPFVFYTATYTDERDRELALGLGAEEFIVKPEDPDVFLRTILQVIEQARTSPAVSAEPVSDPPTSFLIDAVEAEDASHLKKYSAVLIRKLEAKMAQLEQVNRALERNIAERKLAVDALRESETKLSNALQMARASNWKYDVVRDTFTFNDNFYRIFRTTAAEMGGYEMSSADYARRFCHPDDAALVGKGVKEAIETRDPNYSRQLEHRILYADGEVGYITVRFFIVKDAHGRTVKTYGVNQDITERKLAEKATRDAYAELRAIFDGTANGMWVVDLDHNILRMNSALLAILGLKEEPVGRKCYEVWPATACGSVDCPVARVAGGVDRWESEMEKALPNGTKGSFIVTAQPYHSAEGRLLGVIESFVDVTAYKQSEEALRQAVKMESIGRLAGGIAHDFNNLLTGISGYAALALQQMPESSQPYKDVTHISELAERAANLVRQLLSFSRRQRMVPRVLDLNALVADLLHMLPRIIGEDVTLEFLPASDLANVRADPGQIEQVLMNLAVNARDAMPEGGRLTFETANVVLGEQYAATHGEITPGPYVMLAVADTGSGMDRETLAHAFEPFFTTKDVGKGTGLGLSTAYGIINQHGGCIWAYSELGHGTIIKIYLPSVEADGTAPKPQREPATEQPGTERVLLVEDEDAVRAVAQRALEQMGYTVLAATCPEDAEALFAQLEGRVDLLLTDVVMPGCTGVELYRRLAAYAPHLKVVYMSGYTDSRISGDGFMGPGARFIQKPFDPRELTRQVRELLDGVENA